MKHYILTGLPQSMPDVDQCQSKFWHWSQCRSILINADQFLSILINADQCQKPSRKNLHHLDTLSDTFVWWGCNSDSKPTLEGLCQGLHQCNNPNNLMCPALKGSYIFNHIIVYMFCLVKLAHWRKKRDDVIKLMLPWITIWCYLKLYFDVISLRAHGIV